MMDLMLTAVGAVLLIAFWKWPYRMTSLDGTRDRLFDLREDVRQHFIASGAGLSHPVYLALRNLINGHIRHTESASLVKFLAVTRWVVRHPDIVEAMRDKMERRFKTDDPALKAYVADVRSKAFMIMLDYMLKVSLLGWLMVIVGFALLVLILVKRGLVMVFRAPMSLVNRGADYLKSCGISVGFARRVVAVASAVFAVTPYVGLGGRVAAEAAMEDCAFYVDA